MASSFGAPFLGPRTRLAIPARRALVHPAPLAGRARFTPGAESVWPSGKTADGKEEDLARTPAPEERVSDMLYLGDLRDGWYALTNLDMGVGFAMRFPVQVFPHVWLWRELNGTDDFPWFGRSYVAAVEPFTTAPGLGLGKAAENGTARILAPGASLEVRLLAAGYEARKEPAGVSEAGEAEPG